VGKVEAAMGILTDGLTVTHLPVVYQITISVRWLAACIGASLSSVCDENCRFGYAKSRFRFDFRKKITISILILNIITALVIRLLHFCISEILQYR